MISEGVECFWLMRSPGGPIRVLGFEVASSEKTAKQKYRGTFSAKVHAFDMNSEVPWPLCKLVSKEEVLSTYPHLLQLNRRTGRPRAYFEFTVTKAKAAAKQTRKPATNSPSSPPEDTIVSSDSLGQ